MLALLPSLLALSAPAVAQEAAPEVARADPSSDTEDAYGGPRWTVTVDPLTFAIGYAHVQVERRLSPRFSLYAGPHARLYDGVLTEEPEPFLGVGAEAGLRWFPLGEAPRGTWVMARSVLAFLWTTDGTERRTVGGYSSVLVGYTAILGDRFVLSGGAGYNQLYYRIGELGPSGPFLALHTNVGVAF